MSSNVILCEGDHKGVSQVIGKYLLGCMYRDGICPSQVGEIYVEVPYVCISRRHHHLRCWIGSDREEEKLVRLHQPSSVERSAVRIFKGMKISSIPPRCLHLLD